MLTIRHLFAFVATLATNLSYASLQEDAPAGRPGELVAVECRPEGGVIDGYTLYLPESHGPDAAPFPIVLFLQGGSAVGGEIDAVNVAGLPKQVQDARGTTGELARYVRDTFIVVSPHLSDGSFDERQFYRQEGAILAILDEVLASYRADPARVYLTGLSRGGHGSWGLASRLPGRFAAVVPICGAFHGVQDFAALAKMPIWTAHNRGDGVVEHEGTVVGLRKIEQQGGEPFLVFDSVEAGSSDFMDYPRIFISFDEAGHDAWTATYARVELYQWLLRHEIAEAAPAGS